MNEVNLGDFPCLTAGNGIAVSLRVFWLPFLYVNGRKEGRKEGADGPNSMEDIHKTTDISG